MRASSWGHSFSAGSCAQVCGPARSWAFCCPNVNAVALTLFGFAAFGRVVAMLNFTAGLRQFALRLRDGADPDGRHVPALRRAGQAGRSHRGTSGRRGSRGRRRAHRLPRGRRSLGYVARQGARAGDEPGRRVWCIGATRRGPTILPSSCSRPARKAGPRVSCSPALTSCRTSGRPRRISVRRRSGRCRSCSIRCPCSTAMA